MRQAFELWRGAAPLLLERLNIERSCLAARWGLAGHSALGTWLAYPAGAEQLALRRRDGCADELRRPDACLYARGRRAVLSRAWRRALTD